jgi:succinyl-diaminopimelate desuccinylase
MNGANDVVELARTLIRAASPNPGGDERLAAEAVQAALPALGLPAARVVARDERRPNLMTELDFGPGGKHLVFNGHLDTKPIGDAGWTVDPLAADIDGDRLYGLGSADMKAAIAAMLVAASTLAKRPPSRGRLTLLLTADEEDGAEFGAQYVAATEQLGADAVVIGEPGGIHEDFDRLHVVSRGIARLRLIASARQGHSSLSSLLDARNAGIDLARLIGAVADDLHLPTPANMHGLRDWDATVNPALTFAGGVGYGVLPDRVAAATEVRVLPGMRRDDVLAAFERVAGATAAQTGAALSVEFDAPPNDWLAPAAVQPDHLLVSAARRACDHVFGAEPPLSVFPGTTDATWFDNIQAIPTLPALGPGLLARAHGADEWVSIDAVQRSVPLYARLAADFCSADAEATHGDS